MQRLRFLLLLLVALPCAAFPQGRISGVVFGDYFYNAARDSNFSKGNLPNSATGGPKSLQGFVIRRINISYDYDISEQFSTRFRLEMDASSAGATTANGKLAPYVKDAWLKWKGVFGGSDLIFGIQPSSAFDVSEAAWSYRSLEKTIMDLRGIVPSRFFGLALKGKLDDAGSFSYWAMVSNREAGTNPKDLSAAANMTQNDKYNVYSLQLQIKPSKQFLATVYGDFRPAAPVNDLTSTTVPPATVGHAMTTLAGFLNFTEPDQFSIGLEAFLQMTANSYVDPSVTPVSLKGNTAMGVSVWAWVNLQPTLSLVGRYDMYDPRTGSANVEKGNSRNSMLFGVVAKPDKHVQIMPNVQVETYESIPNGPSFDTSITGRVTFAWTF
jgi:hypothetical protein